MYDRIRGALDRRCMTPAVLATIELAKATRARLALCHAIDETLLAQREVAKMRPNSVGKTEARLRLGAQTFLEEQPAALHAAGIEADIRVVESAKLSVPDMLVEAANDWQADLLILGSHGQRGVELFFVGSTAERPVHEAHISLLLVRNEDVST